MKDRQCVICKKIYSPTGKAQLYCSKECFLQSRKMRRRNEKEPRNCEWCGKSFIPKYGRRYCSPECSQAAEKKYHREYNLAYYTKVKAARAERARLRKMLKPEKPKKPRVCPVCKGEFFTKDYRKTFCSVECRKEDHRKKMAQYMKKRYWRLKAEAEAKGQPISKPAPQFTSPAPRAVPRMNAKRLPAPYIKRGAVKCV